MKLLALDTATEACSVALWVDGALLERFELAGRDHTQRLPAMLHALMADAGLGYSQLDGLVCGLGPGSFAGVRIGVAYLQGLALAHGQPALGVSSLAMLAQGAIRACGAERVLAAIDARMDEVYCAAYGRDDAGLAVPLDEARVCRPERVPAQPGRWQAVGTGWGRYEAELRAATGADLSALDGQALPRAGDALRLAVPAFVSGAAGDAALLAPIYLRNRIALTLLEQAALRAKTPAA
ncbi:tRNA (adenosine(37)-N6)-threonylcarbamoyltransferase complex dimerization subunit type 1 TsaB [Stagnimonas aquatica]|uniref:tRNA threonylcarbamoyladenosine biosynthesis protein TsaB n=1 Tax=Stagnimonas aquatica TaxID=2689987 RepID=A0A3N0VE69_9GAMM|nr:tRNA (adenosine(37)-N6)-threonylcarbamoyltransferase complex dimerization subunit type 1 TsaB [Stagnimonas aquatica]ROH91049.1 tRNA (adenosine(37)-N6)-threonylcarbamoyltransferase complex dimerization subunit type 1 TsaB [Stagnimonas aquatica]